MSKPRRPKKPTAPTTPKPILAKEQFPELNATFYTANPSEFLMMRIEALSLMCCTEGQLKDAYGADRSIGSSELGATVPPDDDARQRYVAVEALILFHHAAEMILRMFYAHSEQKECPWLGMSSSTSFVEFKRKVEASLKNGFDHSEIAYVFFGGTDPRDAGLHMTQEEFDEGVEGVAALLSECALRLLSESFIYNAAKHGLSSILLDDSTRIEIQNPDGESVPLHSGPMHMYLHKLRSPGAEKGGREWFVSATGVLPDRDLNTSNLIQRALVSLWAVAKRRYTGEPGEINVFSRGTVDDCVYAAILSSKNLLKTATFELAKEDEYGNVGGIEVDQEMHRIPEAWLDDHSEGSSSTRPVESKRISLIRRARDSRIFNPGNRHFLPFSPKGSQRV
jgi:hypothetical protein